ncbi:MAG: CoA transferase [Myxococcales bacterium]|nr:CoA transferase [Myxococcales bacterium]MCB9648894.1 CoA transferase [Deltaproteobacteria bacterium]
MDGPLRGLRVVDLSRLLPGPYATRQLAELGAEVIKVEDPLGGDYARWYPPLMGEPPASGIFRELNRGKKSVALDLKRPEAQEALRILIGTADVLVDSFRPGVLARLGLDPAALMKAHPRLIYCAITGFGLTGPDASRAGHDMTYQAKVGALSMGPTAGRPGLGPLQIADLGGALVAVSGILLALYERERTGVGKVVDTALSESALAFASVYFGKDLAGEAPRRGEEMLDGSRPSYTLYDTADGRWLAVAPLEPKFWSAFLKVVELPHLAHASMDGGAQGEAVKAEIQARLRTRTAAEWAEAFEGVEACVEVVQDIAEARRDPHLMARGAFRPDGTCRSPIRVGSFAELAAAPEALGESPGLGEHTEAVLRAAGVPDALVASLAG